MYAHASSKDYALWMEVQELMKYFTVVRAEEREFASIGNNIQTDTLLGFQGMPCIPLFISSEPPYAREIKYASWLSYQCNTW